MDKQIRLAITMNVRLLLNLLICSSLAFGCGAGMPTKQIGASKEDISVSVQSSESTKLKLNETETVNDNDQQPKLDIKYDLKAFDSEGDAVLALAQLAQKGAEDENQTIIMSSDSLSLITDLYSNKSFQEIIDTKSVFVVLNDSAQRFSKNSTNYIKKSYHDDKIGFIVTTITTVAETITWAHVGPLSTIEKSANIVYTVALALYFKLNKDKWTEHTKRLKKPFENFFKLTDSNSKAKKLVLDFGANLALSTAVSLVRIPLMSMNQIINSGISLQLFQMPILLSVVATASFFTWSEHQGGIDKNSQPAAKFVFRRLGEVRSILVATFASTAALLNPAVFGIAPWITLSVVGVAGLGLYLKGEQINNWVESHIKSGKLRDIIRYNTVRVFRCESLFRGLELGI